MGPDCAQMGWIQGARLGFHSEGLDLYSKGSVCILRREMSHSNIVRLGGLHSGDGGQDRGGWGTGAAHKSPLQPFVHEPPISCRCIHLTEMSFPFFATGGPGIILAINTQVRWVSLNHPH